MAMEGMWSHTPNRGRKPLGSLRRSLDSQDPGNTSNHKLGLWSDRGKSLSNLGLSNEAW